MLYPNSSYLSDRSCRPDYLCGWRYIISPSFRMKVHNKCGGNLLSISLFIIGSLAGMVLTSIVFIIVTVGIWQLVMT